MIFEGASRRAAFGAAFVGALLSTGCGYQFVDYSAPPPGVETATIRMFVNDSYEPGIEVVFTDAMRREFLRRGAIRLVEDGSPADLVISGRVPRISTRSRSFSTVALSLEWEITVRLQVRARMSDGSEIPFDRQLLTESERYLASADIEAARKNRDEAVRKIASVLATRVHDVIYEARQ